MPHSVNFQEKHELLMNFMLHSPKVDLGRLTFLQHFSWTRELDDGNVRFRELYIML